MTNRASRDGTPPRPPGPGPGGARQCFARVPLGGGRGAARAAEVAGGPCLSRLGSVCHFCQPITLSASRKGDSPSCQTPLPLPVSPSPDFNPQAVRDSPGGLPPHSCSGSHPTETITTTTGSHQTPPAIHAAVSSASILAFASCEALRQTNGADNSYVAVGQPAIP